MADKFKRTLPVDISFTAGEMPTATKLNALVSGVKTALTTIEKFLGDGWDESYPYFSTSDTLAAPTINMFDTVLGGEKKLEMTSLSRLIGPSSALNPKHLSHVSETERSVTESITAGRTSFRLRYSPVDTSSLVWSDTTTFANRKLSVGLVLVAGDYYVNSFTGEVNTITTTGAGSTVTYKTAGWFDAFAAYPGSSFNVIPDPNQATKCTASGPTDGKYTITLPTITHQEADDTDLATALSDDDLNYGVQLQLPEVLNHLASGDTIPEGFLYIRDDNTNEVFRSASYYYVSATQLKVGGVTLDTSHGFTVITVGTTITQSIQDLQTKLFRLRRGLDSGYAIKIDNVTGLVGPSRNTSLSGSEPYVPSEAPNNHLPQYLHRDGYFGTDYDDGNINDSNGMRGDLVMLATTRNGSNTRAHLDSSSALIWFGKQTTGPQIKYHRASGTQGYLYLKGPNEGLYDDGVYVDDQLSVVTGIKSGTTSSAGFLKWHVVEGTMVVSGGAGAGTMAVTTLDGKDVVGISIVIEIGAGAWYGPGDNAVRGYQASWDTVTDSIDIDSALSNGNYDCKAVIFYIEP